MCWWIFHKWKIVKRSETGVAIERLLNSSNKVHTFELEEIEELMKP